MDNPEISATLGARQRNKDQQNKQKHNTEN
jgi:hypothetical protein